GKQVSQLVMLGTPNSGSLAAVQALRGTYSVVRKIAMLDLRHNAEFLARNVFASFPGLHELLPANKSVSDFDLFDAAAWPAKGPGPDAALLRAASGLEQRMAPADARFTMVVGCNRTTATGVALRDGANARAAATAVAVLRGVPASGAAADIDQRLGGVIGDWLQHRVVSGDAGHVTPIPRSLLRKARNPRTAFLLVGLGRFDRLSLD